MGFGVAGVATGGRHHTGRLNNKNSIPMRSNTDSTTKQGFSFPAGPRRMVFEGLVILAKGTKKPHTISAHGHKLYRATVEKGQKMESSQILCTAAQPKTTFTRMGSVILLPQYSSTLYTMKLFAVLKRALSQQKSFCCSHRKSCHGQRDAVVPR